MLLAIIFIWTPPHFWALALDRVEDYRDADIPMLPVTHGEMHTKWQILFYTLALVAVSVAPWAIGMERTGVSGRGVAAWRHLHRLCGGAAARRAVRADGYLPLLDRLSAGGSSLPCWWIITCRAPQGSHDVKFVAVGVLVAAVGRPRVRRGTHLWRARAVWCRASGARLSRVRRAAAGCCL